MNMRVPLLFQRNSHESPDSSSPCARIVQQVHPSEKLVHNAYYERM